MKNAHARAHPDAATDELRTHFGADAPAVACALASKMNATTDHVFIEQAQ